MKSRNTVFHIAYGIMLGMFVIIIVLIAVRGAGKSLAQSEYDRTEPFMSGWHTADGTELDEKTLRKISGISDGETGIFNTLPESAANADVLFFRAKNVFYSVYIDGEPVCEPDFGESPFYTNSTGVRYISVSLSPDYVGKEVEIRYTVAYSGSRCGFDGFRIGSSSGAILSVISEKLVAFIVCVLMLFSGLFLSIADIPINMRAQKNHELLFLGLFSICVSVWCLSELNIIQLFFDDSRLLHVLSCGSLMLIPIPLVLYLDKAIGFKLRFIVPLVCTLSILEFVVCWTLHLLKIKDIHDTITASHALIGISAILLIYSFIKNLISARGKSTSRIYRVLRSVGMASIGIAAFIDIPRYYMGLTGDSAQFVRVGILIFTICYGIASLENTINAVKKGVQTEFISKLAYQDGLTGVGNRTAFEERLDELEKIKATAAPIILIMFDVNDLKFVNDNLGHPLGDSMIKTAAEMIRSSFEPSGGECFRIGGDEFAVIMHGNGVATRYDKHINEFADQMELHNRDMGNKFRISIAHGFFIYNSGCGVDTIKEAFKKADEHMYETKREMKAHQSSPQEYYADRLAKLNN